MGSLRNDRRNRRLSLAVGACLALATGSVLADAPKASSATQPGLLTFSNVKVIDAPATVAAKKRTGNAQSQQGLRAYVDPASGQLRPQTMEEGKQIANEAKVKAGAKSTAGARSRVATLSSEVASASEAEVIYGAANAIGMEIGEEFEVYQVVRRTVNGLQTSEFHGKANANKAVFSETNSDRSEVSHDR
jgi:hypothetical protein